MKFKETIVKTEDGLTAKKAAELVNLCSKFESEIFLKQGSKKVNSKSIMGVISMSLQFDDCVTVITEGNDEEKALETVIEFFN